MEGERMEVSNMFSVLADSQYDEKQNGAIPFGVTTTNAEISAENNSVKNVSISETNEKYAKSPVTSGGYANSPQSSRNWADIVENDENFEQPKKRKRLLPSESASQSLPGPSRQTKTTRDSTTPRQPSYPRNTIEQIKVSRQMLAQCRSKAAAGTYDQMTYLEFSPEFTQVDYIKALENKLGKGCVVQIGKASGQILVGFERPDMAETIIEDGLMIKGALLKALPYQKKAEKITISGLPFVIEDADIIRTLRPYCQVVSIAPTVNSSGGYTWLDLKKTAFILMNNGKKITDLPKKIIVTAKGGSALAYLEYGFRCSKCYRMGHKRMNCPRIIRETSTTQPLSQTSSVKTTAPAPNTTAAASPPATFSHPAPVAAPAQTSSAPPAQEDIALETEPTTRTPETSTQTDLNINRVENSSHHKIKDRSRSLSPKAGSTTQLQLDTLLERLPGSFFEEVTLLGLKEEEVKQAIVSLPHLRLLLGKLSVEQSLGLHTFNEKLIKGLGSSKSIELCCFLKQHAVDIAFIQETNVTTLDSVEDLCLGYRAAVVPASGARGSGLACIFSSGVQVIGQQVLSPGKIAAFDVTIRGSKATFVNCHLSHAPDERLQQLQVIAAAAVNEDAWVLEDLNISEVSASDIASGSVEALGELLDRANLVDAAAIFDATHLPTRISSCGSRVDASRLDRVLIPSSFSNRVTRYWSLYYKNSDHRAVLLQTGEASEPRPPCIASMLRSRLVVGTVETLLDEALGNIEDMRNAEIWRRWGHIKAHLASAIKSLHDLRNNDDDYISRARKYVQAKLEDVSIYSDYPSLPDLGRALRLRRRGTSSNTFYDSAGRMITGPAVRELAFVNLKERFSHPSCSPEDIDGFLRGFTLRVTIEESDPLHRYGIGEEEIVAAIGRLPTGKAAGWDDLPCELFRGFEDYFASALRRVFEASQLCGALPTSMRRSEMSLIEKPHGGPGLAGLRPLSLPTTDYRVLSGVLYWRLRPHLRDIVPECQSYAVPGRTPAWNIARVADEVATACRDEAPLAVVAIDLESAFDTLDRGFLVSTLLSVGLPPVFVGWVLLLYAGAEAAARIEGIGRTPLFHMLNGVRQGCAASAAFFTISTGPLLLRLEQLLGRDNVLAYADDIVLLIREDGQLEVVRKIFEDFRRASGIRVNFGKSQGLWCGRWRNRTDSPSAISWNREKINILGTLVTPGMGTSAQDQHLQELLERAIARWSPFVRGLSLAGRAKAANSLVLSAIYYHLQAYLPSETTIGRLQARLARFVWGHDRTSWLPSSILARPISVGGMGLLDVGTQLRLSCLKGVQAALRGGRNAHPWLAESGMWLTPASTPGIWLPPRRRRSLHLFESAAEILDLNHRILQPALLRALRVVGDCRFLRPPELLAPTRWLGWRIGELTGPAPNITIATRGALTDVTALGSFCTRLITQNARGRYRVDSLADAIVVRGTTTAFQRLTTRTARRLLERPRLAALPITQLFGRWFPHVSIPISINWSSLRRCAFSGHNADVAVRLALQALPHPAHPASARESCIACGSGDLSLAHRYWSCSRIRPVILEAFTILQRPPDLQSWIFGHDLEDDALAIMASAKTRIYKHFLGLEMRGVQEDPLLVWRRTLSSQENGLQAHMNSTENPQGSTEISANESDMAESLSDSNNRKDANSEPAADGGHANSRRNWADCPELNDQLPDGEDGIFTTVGGSKKRPHDPDHVNSGAKKGCVQAPRIAPNSSRPRVTPRASRVRECQTTRQKQATFRARSAAMQADQCVYLEFCPDFTEDQYFLALEAKLGKGTVYQLTKMEGQFLVGLSGVQQADKLVEDGLEIEDALLRATPLKKRAERIMFGNVPFFVENLDLVAALQPFGQITSIVQKMKELGESYWADARREAFITLRDGVKLSHIPARLNIKAKGVTSHVYVTYGIRCSLCYKHGHKRANCPRKTGVQEANLLLHLDSPAGPNNAGGRQPSSSNVMPAPVPTPAAGPSSTAALIPDVTLEPPAAPPTPATSPVPPAAPAPAPETLPTASVDPVPPTSKQCRGGARKTHKKSNVTRTQLNELLERIHSNILDKSGLEGLEREEVLDALASVPGADRRPARLQLRSLQAPIGRSCPDEERPMSFRLASINARGLAARERSIELCHFLRQHRVDVAFIQETNTSSLDPIQHLCLGYSAATVPPAALRGSGLACFFAPGVAVLRQRVLWPGNISIVSIDVRGQEVRVINCHLSHIPRERLEQLESITAAAIQEDAWVVGDLNIDEQSPSDITSGSVEALTELMDQTALVDVATLFDAEHLPTRVASCRSRVDAARLDRILLPSRFLERVTLYKTIYYRLSDHRAILTQMGSPHSPRQPYVAAMLRSALVDEHLLATIERTSGSIADMSSEALWIRWSKIKAELLAEVRSLHVPRVADDDHISRARRYLQARLEAASSAADYPSLPDLVRSLRVRRPAGTTIRDEDGSVIDGGELRRRAYSVYQRRFACESGDPIAAAEFIRGTTTTLTLEEDDPLTRPDITGADIAAAIRRLPLGKAPGWDELPCEFLITYEDFFVEALRRVFEASKLRGALPSSIRRSTICLVPKSNGGPGLSGYRPISLPTADYRVLGNILLQRLRPHLPALVPRCQTYAVPGRSPSWNVARVADEIDLATRNGSELAVISTDLESAFDTLDRCFLVSLMVSLRLPPAFVEWFLLLYAGADAAVRAGGLHTKPFHLLNGVRQGCAISAALFSLATGPLLVRLERALGPGNVLAYADDIVLLIRRDELFDVVRIIFEDFRRASGIGVNFAKCKGLWCGAWRARTDTQLGISWTSEQIRVLGCNLTPAVSSSAQEQHLLALLESAVARWVPFTRGLSLVGRARAANSLVLSAVVHHLHGYLPTDSTIAKLQARLVRFVWGPRRTTWLPGGVLARPVSVGGFGLLDIRTQLRLACLRGVQTALRGGLNAYSWLTVSGTWLTPPTSGTWHPPRRRRLLKLWEAVSEILELNHRVLPPHQLQELHIIGDSRFLRPPDLLVASRWAGMRVGDLTSSSSLPLRTTRAALADIAALTTFCSRIVEENRNHTHRVDNIKDGIVLRGTATAFQRLTTRTARRMLERPRLAALPITQLLARWLPHVSIPISISWPSLRRGAFSGHNADVAVRLALHALPHPAHPASARESCIACGSGDLSLAHRYWSCSRIRPVILEAFTILQRPPDLQSWIFGHDLEDDALAIMASAKTRIYKYFLGLEMRGVQEDPLLVWRRTLS
ncbi:hypothetical protein LAZ67_9002175, partial [Cordylochernes scorpioides]